MSSSGNALNRQTWVAVLCATSLLAGCSMIRLAYDNGERLLLSRLDSFLNLNSGQETAVSTALRARLDAHRRDELPEVARWLDDGADAFARGMTPAVATALTDRATDHFVALAERSMPLALVALNDLDARQQNHLAAKLADRADSYREKYQTGAPNERLAAREGRIVGRLEHWTSTLDTKQKALVVAHVREMRDGSAAWAGYRDAQSATLLSLLARDAGDDEVEAHLRAYLLEVEGAPADLVAAREHNVAVVQRMVVALAATLDAAQTETLQERLRGYAEDARVLASRSSRTGRVALRQAAAPSSSCGPTCAAPP